MSTSPKTKRKLLVTGDYTYLLTLPKAWVKKLKWRAKQMVEPLALSAGSRTITSVLSTESVEFVGRSM